MAGLFFLVSLLHSIASLAGAVMGLAHNHVDDLTSELHGIQLLQISSAKIKSEKAASCAGGWPSFQSHADLQKDPWGKYFSLLYGEVPDMDFPLCVGDFWMFYHELLSQAGVSNIPESVGDCPQASFSHYNKNNKLSPPGVSWSWHPGPYSGWQDNAWVEVIHQQNPFGQDESQGGWMFSAKGSGMWFNLGKTIVFRDEFEALKHFNVTFFPNLSMVAMKQGYQSMQLVGRAAGAIALYPDCWSNPASAVQNVEIVAFGAHGQTSCMADEGTFQDISVGWQGSKGTCTCDTSRTYLNCDKYTP